jgi:outer membrane protein W
LKISSLLLLLSAAVALEAKDWTAELRAGAFIPFSKKLKSNYGSAWIEGEFETTYAFTPYLLGWGNAGYFDKTGHSLKHHHRSHIQAIPFSAGLKFLFFTRHFRPYAGIGPSYTLMHIRNYISTDRVYVNSFGFVAKSGIYIDLPKHFLLDLFFDYYYTRMHAAHPYVTINAGGFRTGLGLGYRF